MYEFGIGVDADENEAFYYYKKAVDAGDVLAIDSLSKCYREGIGTAPNFEKAEELSSLFRDVMNSMKS